ncbi:MULTISPECIES: DUF4391 domain-containing protein [unclassified Empedobacter]|uniref:DUF4391 domain-containing protein n=1 Tax=unclassified Empedobacter TaxID=2643773 RepID=UPI0025C1EB3B|nr:MULTISPECIES: DUF4391 domain-containing protein [unclassified Empedobacter]
MDWKTILQLPAQCQVDSPIKKTSLKKMDGITTSEIKLIDQAEVQSIRVFGFVTQKNANISSYETETESFLDIYFVRLIIAEEVYQKLYKPVTRLLHKLIPHHCVIIVEDDKQKQTNVSLYKKSINQSNHMLRVLNEEIISTSVDKATSEEFFEQLSFDKANKINLKAFYNYYIQIFQNFNLVDLTGEFKVRTLEQTEQFLKMNEEVVNYETKIKSYQNQLKTVTQMNEKVRLNSEIYQLKNKINDLKNKL